MLPRTIGIGQGLELLQKQRNESVQSAKPEGAAKQEPLESDFSDLDEDLLDELEDM